MNNGPKRTSSVQSERAVLVGVLLETPVNPDHPLDEIGGLAETAGAQVVAELTQRRDRKRKTPGLRLGVFIEIGWDH